MMHDQSGAIVLNRQSFQPAHHKRHYCVAVHIAPAGEHNKRINDEQIRSQVVEGALKNGKGCFVEVSCRATIKVRRERQSG